MKLGLILVCAALLPTLPTVTSILHSDIYLTLCSDTDEEVIIGLDGEEKWHADFSQNIGMLTLPMFAVPVDYVDGTYDTSVFNIENCKQCLTVLTPAVTEPADAPQSSIYTKENVELGSNNTLICYITGFYPPHIKVTWTKNNVIVTDVANFSNFYPIADGTYKLVSTLSFIPEKGDVYTCSVNHTALDRPLIKVFDVQVALPRIGPAVFCGVGLGVGLIGVIIGIVLLIKGRKFS
ncbi:H-2 class II histocompatibility antigen, A-U alpha chain-like [Hoplias malabaricus]|uniref:H-2 class II histocompatibility antigen, A-U alpha chain-like n=1 Tax=Hoplias malabaricus TaxID=27720 RepID=UPI003463313E